MKQYYTNGYDNKEDAFIHSQRMASKKKLVSTPFSKIPSALIEYIWPNCIAKKKITIFVGKGGKGKSQMLAYIAAGISVGARIPCSDHRFPKGKVMMLAAEDTPSDTIRPRLMANGANLDLVTSVEASSSIDKNGKKVSGFIRLDEDLELLGELLSGDPTYQLVIIDPITAYLGAVDDNKNADLRALLVKISDLAVNHNVSIILNTHFGKNVDIKSATEKILGSVAYGAVARSVMVFADYPEDEEGEMREERLVFQNSKNNLAKREPGMVYTIEPCLVHDAIPSSDGSQVAMAIKTSRIHFTGDRYTGTSDSLVEKKKTRSADKMDECCAWLRNRLANGSVPVKVLRSEWEALSPDNHGSLLYRVKEKERYGIIEDCAPREGRDSKLTFWTLLGGSL